MKTRARTTTITWISIQPASWILTALVILGSPAFAGPERICSKTTFVDIDQLLALPYSGAPLSTMAGGGYAETVEAAADPDRDPIRVLAGTSIAADPISPEGMDAVLAIDRPGVFELVPAGILISLGPGPYPIVGASGENLEEALRFYEICDGITDADDDRCTCASEIELGSVTFGEIRGYPPGGTNGGLPDVDVFTFTLTHRQTILLETVGPIDTCELFDGSGYPLAAKGDGGDRRNLLIVATLAGGRYFLRIIGSGESQGRYALLTSVADAPEAGITWSTSSDETW